MKKMPKAPLYRDPIYDGAADPTVVYNGYENKWWMVYTQRRANQKIPGVAYCHGTEIGIASSNDDGLNWTYRGTMQGLEFENGKNTFWAPEIIYHDGLYHMYVSYIQGIPIDWSGERHIIHYTSSDCFNWSMERILDLSSDYVIDACVYQLPDGSFRMIYKDEADGSSSHIARSVDLYNWDELEPVVSDEGHEGPFVFKWKDFYWMIVDKWKGLGVYRSEDGQKWISCHQIILSEVGERQDDATFGRHASVVVKDNQAYIFYFTHPDWDDNADDSCLSYSHKRTSIQVAKLSYKDDHLICNRNEPFELKL